MRVFKQALAALALASIAYTAHAETPVPMAASPEEVGLSSVQLKKLEAVTRQQIDDGLVPGAVMLVARRGKIAWVSVQGKRDPAQPDPMKLDSI
ncbi:MAG TPA: serine hydrolase, partial [Reyranella sp.]|nr:serine hydrolase [Reyranella sp.]